MTVIKQLNLMAAMLLFSVACVTAQESRAEQFERIEAEKIAFITKELNLTPTEAQKFFPVYNQYYKEMSRLRHERRGNRKPPGQRDELQSQKIPSTSLTPTNRDVLAFDAKELDLKKVYRNRFASVVGQARASRFFEVEEEFRNYLLRELQQRRRDKDHD